MTNSEARKRHATPPTPDALDAIRFWPKVRKTETCWLWLAGVGRNGYGQFHSGGRTVPAHRWSFEAARGAVPEGLVLDHLCRVRHCVNPEHLEPIPNTENVLKGIGITAINKRKTHCKHGHEFTPENTYNPPSKPHGRICRTCMAERARKAGRRPMTCAFCGKEISGKHRTKHYRTVHADQMQASA